MSFVFFFFFQAEDGIRDLVRSRGLGDVYKRQDLHALAATGATQACSPCLVQVDDDAAVGAASHDVPYMGALDLVADAHTARAEDAAVVVEPVPFVAGVHACLLYTSDAAGERSSVDLGGRRIIHKKKKD